MIVTLPLNGFHLHVLNALAIRLPISNIIYKGNRFDYGEEFVIKLNNVDVHLDLVPEAIEYRVFVMHPNSRNFRKFVEWNTVFVDNQQSIVTFLEDVVRHETAEYPTEMEVWDSLSDGFMKTIQEMHNRRAMKMREH